MQKCQHHIRMTFGGEYSSASLNDCPVNQVRNIIDRIYNYMASEEFVFSIL